MLHLYFLSSILTISITYTWYSFYGAQYFFKYTIPERNQERVRPPKHVVPVYMWDIYNNGINSSEIDVVRGIYPSFTGSTFNSLLYRYHRTRRLEFKIPKSNQNEILVKTELKITINSGKNQTTFFQVYLKNKKWIFLDEKKVSSVNKMWISLQVTSKNQPPLKTGSVTFLILTLSRNCQVDFFHPVLLLSYAYKKGRSLKREKRSTEVEDYEEETNRIWRNGILLQGVRNTCRRKPLYVDFSELDYDSWIVAPSGYEAFQCVGKCTFPISEHLSPTKHAILQTLLHDISPRKAARACCVPTRLDPISILYVDENGVLTYRFRYRDMVVAECGCR